MIIIENVEEVVTIAESLIEEYKESMERHEKHGYINMAISVKGSIIGVVALLCRITDKSADDYFREIFPEDWE